MQSILSSGILMVSLFGFVALPVPGLAGFPSFKQHTIDNIGNKMGQTSLVDIDKDGDLDWIVGCRGGDIWWFEYRSASQWIRHRVGIGAPTDVGGCAFDVCAKPWNGDEHVFLENRKNQR